GRAVAGTDRGHAPAALLRRSDGADHAAVAARVLAPAGRLRPARPRPPAGPASGSRKGHARALAGSGDATAGEHRAGGTADAGNLVAGRARDHAGCQPGAGRSAAALRPGHRASAAGDAWRHLRGPAAARRAAARCPAPEARRTGKPGPWPGRVRGGDQHRRPHPAVGTPPVLAAACDFRCRRAGLAHLPAAGGPRHRHVGAGAAGVALASASLGLAVSLTGVSAALVTGLVLIVLVRIQRLQARAGTAEAPRGHFRPWMNIALTLGWLG